MQWAIGWETQQHYALGKGCIRLVIADLHDRHNLGWEDAVEWEYYILNAPGEEYKDRLIPRCFCEKGDCTERCKPQYKGKFFPEDCGWRGAYYPIDYCMCYVCGEWKENYWEDAIHFIDIQNSNDLKEMIVCDDCFDKLQNKMLKTDDYTTFKVFRPFRIKFMSRMITPAEPHRIKKVKKNIILNSDVSQS